MIQVKICKWLKLLNSVPFIKKALENHVYIRIWSSWLTFTVLQWMKKNSKISQFLQWMKKNSKISQFLQWMKKNSKISQFSSFLLSSAYAIVVKVWKWLKLLNSVPFIKNTDGNHVYILIWSFWLTFTVLQWMKKNSKISQFSSFLLRTEKAIFVKIQKWWKLLILFHSSRKHFWIKFTLLSNLIILTDFHSFKVSEDKVQN